MFGCNYDNLKEQLKTKYQVLSNEEQLLTMLISMFDYDIDIPFEFIEFFLLTTGKCAFWENDEKLIVSQCQFIGNIDEYGIGKDIVCTTLNGKQKTFKNWRENDNVVVMYNNDTYTPDMNFPKFASYFAEVEKSLHHLIINTRYSNIIRAKDDKERAIYTKAIESNESGKPNVVVSNNIFGDDTDNPILNLTDPTQADKIQYLSKYHEDLRRRLSNIYGMSSSGTEKIAQQSTKEIENGRSICWIVPVNRLNNRTKAINDINKKFKTNYSVDFSETWKKEYEKWKKEMSETSETSETIINESRGVE